MKTKILFLATLLLGCFFANAQTVASSPEYIKALTVEWTGERFADGRPKVSDNLLERLKNITLEEAWAELIELGYFNQFEGNWKLLNENDNYVMTGRAVTAQFMPHVLIWKTRSLSKVKSKAGCGNSAGPYPVK
jgi:4-hydroxy-4-methyl-2-oxoglutarate aldolase